MKKLISSIFFVLISLAPVTVEAQNKKPKWRKLADSYRRSLDSLKLVQKDLVSMKTSQVQEELDISETETDYEEGYWKWLPNGDRYASNPATELGRIYFLSKDTADQQLHFFSAIDLVENKAKIEDSKKSIVSKSIMISDKSTIKVAAGVSAFNGSSELENEERAFVTVKSNDPVRIRWSLELRQKVTENPQVIHLIRNIARDAFIVTGMHVVEIYGKKYRIQNGEIAANTPILKIKNGTYGETDEVVRSYFVAREYSPLYLPATPEVIGSSSYKINPGQFMEDDTDNATSNVPFIYHSIFKQKNSQESFKFYDAPSTYFKTNKSEFNPEFEIMFDAWTTNEKSMFNEGLERFFNGSKIRLQNSDGPLPPKLG